LVYFSETEITRGGFLCGILKTELCNDMFGKWILDLKIKYYEFVA